MRSSPKDTSATGGLGQERERSYRHRENSQANSELQVETFSKAADYRNRTIGSIPQVNPTDPNSIGSFAAENGAVTKGEMGEGSEGIAASSGGSENNCLGTCQTYDVCVSPQEDRSSAAGTVGEGEGGAEEGGLA